MISGISSQLSNLSVLLKSFDKSGMKFIVNDNQTSPCKLCLDYVFFGNIFQANKIENTLQ